MALHIGRNLYGGACQGGWNMCAGSLGGMAPSSLESAVIYTDVYFGFWKCFKWRPLIRKQGLYYLKHNQKKNTAY